MRRESHVRFYEGPRVRLPRATRLIVLVSSHPLARHWAPKVEQRLREELGKLDLTVNEDKSRVANFGAGEPFDFLGYTFRLVDEAKPGGKKMVLARPQKKKRTAFLRQLSKTMRKFLHRPVTEVVHRIVNPRVRGWVGYFRWGNAGGDLSFVEWQVDKKVRRFASRQRPKRCGGRGWTTWSAEDIYKTWGLFHAYQVLPRSEPRPQRA